MYKNKMTEELAAN